MIRSKKNTTETGCQPLSKTNKRNKRKSKLRKKRSKERRQWPLNKSTNKFRTFTSNSRIKLKKERIMRLKNRKRTRLTSWKKKDSGVWYKLILKLWMTKTTGGLPILLPWKDQPLLKSSPQTRISARAKWIWTISRISEAIDLPRVLRKLERSTNWRHQSLIKIRLKFLQKTKILIIITPAISISKLTWFHSRKRKLRKRKKCLQLKPPPISLQHLRRRSSHGSDL